MSLAFSSGENEHFHSLESGRVDVIPVDESRLEAVYELTRCSAWIKDNAYKKVALQFPDNLLVDSVEIALRLEESTQAEVFILGDVTYGSCCVDCISAEHAGADCLVHFGPACLTPLAVDSIPVLFIFVQGEVNCERAASLVKASSELMSAKCLLILYEVSYSQAAYVLGDILKETCCVVVSDLKIPGEDSKPSGNAIVKCQRIINLLENINLSDSSVLYLGSENMTQSNLIMNFSCCPFYTYNPSLGELVKDGTDINRTLRRRFYIVERLKDAKIIGILIGSLGLDKYLPVVDHMKALVKHRKKRSYVLAVGKPNVPKLANFPEIEVFVLVTCGENSFLDSKEFLAPIATPFELELALNSNRDFKDGQYITEYSQLLPGGQNHVPLGNGSTTVEGDVSLVTGNVRTFSSEEEQDGKSSALIKNEMALSTLHARAGGEHLAQRSWQGLEQQLGMTPVTLAKEGQSGTAARYEGEG